MQVDYSLAALRAWRLEFAGRVGLVPTMGALHAGHLRLVEQAQAENDAVVVSIFVNPTQFAATEDLSSYPRTLEADLALLARAGVNRVLVPTPEQVYPPRFQTYVNVEQVSKGLEGASRPTHFRGVTTVVLKLFNLVQPHRAYFGQKDAQQVVVIRQMVRDLNVPVDIRVVPTVREPDGLALSSRNVYLTPSERELAPMLYRALQAAADAYAHTARDPQHLRALMHARLSEVGALHVDYISVADAQTLEELYSPQAAPMLVSLAVQIGKPRLLDNCLLPLELNTLEGLTANLGGS